MNNNDDSLTILMLFGTLLSFVVMLFCEKINDRSLLDY